ncbi:hypothetical protein EB155_14080, partial [archaeon]|nr:hypothetical protein [archaeon]NDB80983.1 hypothetical protein [archaeon]
DVDNRSDEFVKCKSIDEVINKIWKEDYNEEVIENIEYWFNDGDVELNSVVSYNDKKDICYMDFSEELGYWIFKDRKVFDRDDIDVEDILDVCECEVFDLDLKDVNERMYNIISEEK